MRRTFRASLTVLLLTRLTACIDKLRSFYDEGNNFSFILAGLPSLSNRNLNLSVTIPMKQRVSLFLECTGFTLKETKDYIIHQLAQVNARSPIMDVKYFPVLHSLTLGLPRKVDQVLQYYLGKLRLVILPVFQILEQDAIFRILMTSSTIQKNLMLL